MGRTRHNWFVTRSARSKKTRTQSRAGSRVTDITRSISRPTPADAHLGRAAVTKNLLKAGGTLVGVATLVSLVIIPVTDYLDQQKVLAKKSAEFDALADANEQLQNEVNDLSTPEGIRNAARTQLGYVLPGEQRLSFARTPELPTDLPAQWPYTLVTDIVTVRTQVAVDSGAALKSHLP